MGRLVLFALVAAIAGAWAIGAVLHALGVRHSGAHVLAEVVVLFAVSLVALALVVALQRGPPE